MRVTFSYDDKGVAFARSGPPFTFHRGDTTAVKEEWAGMSKFLNLTYTHLLQPCVLETKKVSLFSHRVGSFIVSKLPPHIPIISVANIDALPLKCPQYIGNQGWYLHANRREKAVEAMLRRVHLEILVNEIMDEPFESFLELPVPANSFASGVEDAVVDIKRPPNMGPAEEEVDDAFELFAAAIPRVDTWIHLTRKKTGGARITVRQSLRQST